MRFDMNSCLYSQYININTNDTETEVIRNDDYLYVTTSLFKSQSNNNLKLNIIDRTKTFLLTSTEVYPRSKVVSICFMK